MEISQHIIDEAKSMLYKGVTLPAEIAGAPGFFLAAHEDSSIHAFGAVEQNGIFYKIGAQKPTKTQ
jgi:hypothetical protein